MKLFIVIFFALLFALRLEAQTSSGVSSDGRDFYIGFVAPSYNIPANPRTLAFFGAYFLLSSYSDAHVRVSYFNPSGKEISSSAYSISARSGKQVLVDSSFMVANDTGDIAEYR